MLKENYNTYYLRIVQHIRLVLPFFDDFLFPSPKRAIFGADFFNETWNGWVMVLSGRSAVWTAPGDTALRTLVGWNIEIMFMFAIAGIIFYHTLTENDEIKILGLPEKWFWAIIFSAFCVFVECLLNKGGHLVWEYQFWFRLCWWVL